VLVFVLGLLACVSLNSTGIVLEPLLGQITHLQVTALSEALFGVGCRVRLATVFNRGAAVTAVSTLGTPVSGDGRNPLVTDLALRASAPKWRLIAAVRRSRQLSA
jgi:hypothetical protein